MKKISKLFFILTTLLLTFPTQISAVCPLCTVAVAGGLGLSRWLGIDDTISGIWIGGVLISSSLWFYSWFSKKYPKYNSTHYLLLATIIMYALVVGPLVYYEIIGHPFNKIFGIDKIVFGIVLGTLGFLAGERLDKKIRKARGKQFFNYQKVAFPVFVLLIISLIFYFGLPYLSYL